MKRLLFIAIALFAFGFSFAQAPEKMSYQAVVRNSSDVLITNTTVGMQISILRGSPTGTLVYSETLTPLTNTNGLVSIEFGGGTGFDTINWAIGPFYLKAETDPLGGTTYTISGTSELLSVPYALHAKTAESIAGGITETDPVFGAHAASGITGTLIGNWNTAYTWGNHASAGYLTSFTETDPLWTASPSFGITNTNITNWNSAYGWGNHALAGYLTSYTETDPLWTASPSFGITAGNITNWNSAYGWGNHALAGYLTSFTELDPEVGANTTNYISKWNGTALVSSNIFDNGTTVGIGTTTATTRLQVNPVAGAFAALGVKGTTGAFNPALASVNDYTGFLIHYREEAGFPNMASLVATGNVSGNYGALMSFYTRNYSQNPTERMRITETGNVGIMTAAPAFVLEVNGTAGKPGGGSWSVSSDKRLKKNIEPYTDGLSKLMEINPVWFEYNGIAGLPTDTKYVGVIAQDMLEVLPYTVNMMGQKSSSDATMRNGQSGNSGPVDKNSKDGYYTFDPSALDFILINSVKELNAKNEALQKIIENQQKQIDLMNQKIENLSKK
ncbi:MAG: tail fiber domain-containing protein [Bacteroidota bacterium]